MIEAVRKLLRMNRSVGGGLDLFTDLLIASALEESLLPIDTGRLARFAEEAFTHLVAKPYRGHSIRIRPTEVLAGVPEAPVPGSVIEILDDDMPFLVESVIGAINAAGLTPRLVFHPIFKVARYGSGRLTEVVGPGDRNWAAGGQESFIAAVVDPLDETHAKQLTSALDRVLGDVRTSAVDGQRMQDRLQRAISEIEHQPMPVGAATSLPTPPTAREAVEFLQWLASGNCTLLGMRDYEFVGHEATEDLWPASGGALGIMRNTDAPVLARGGDNLAFSPEIRAFYNRPEPVFVAKSSMLSQVRHRVHLDYVGVKRYSPAGKLIGELKIVGLFGRQAYLQPISAIPIVRRKVQQVLDEAGFPPDSHNGRTLRDVLEDLPRDELFHIDNAALRSWALAILDLQLRPRTRVLSRLEQFGRYVSVLTFVPRDLYSTRNRERIGAYLSRRLGGHLSAFFPYYTAGPLVRTRFIIGLDGPQPRSYQDAELEADIAELLRTWDDRLGRAIAGAFAPERHAALTASYGNAFSAGYEETFDVARAVEDILRIERLDAARPVAIDFYREAGAPDHRVRAALYRFDAPIPLSERVPVLENLGFRVIDERSYHVRPALAGIERVVVLHDMVLETAEGHSIDIGMHELRLEDAFLAVTHGLAENDLMNALVVAAGLDWREVSVFRAYTAYVRQIRAPFGPRYIAETLIRHASIASELFELFRLRFDPRRSAALPVEQAGDELRRRIEVALTAVASLDEDRILRHLLNLVMATVRTSFFRPGEKQEAAQTVAFKFDSRTVDELPEPRPFREIFVYSPRVEGIHLRFAGISRGGIRWSDRAQDFRTEVLGLAKAQQVKNTVIVASGAKGGFVAKQLPRDAPRDVVLQEGIACYRLFITALLSLTDDLSGAEVRYPEAVVRHDGDDPYLVVAADKGTATFSDYANEIASARGFWLGDAFASGGSAGYDHKRMGITARGAWECVRRHFRELGHDIQNEAFRVVGVGDMSGDVFGNGLLLSPATHLVAAFDHRDIFIDPTPDPAVSHAERRRLFELPRSSWADYDRSKISPGGGVFSRNTKSIDLSPEMRALLGVTATSMTPAELMRAILKADADLLWFGGIGTFVRASTETDEQVGDRANDAIRIGADELRARVVGEGANLGITQRGRIEAASRGIRINTDFIDNSAGVNTSDEEVNIKIAMAAAIASGRLSVEQRDQLLVSMTQDVATAVLANNYQQSLAISLAQRTSARDIEYLGRLARQLEQRGIIERKLEVLPSGAEFARLAAAGKGLTRPEIAVLLSWAKIALQADILAGPVPDDPANAHLLFEYFPAALRHDYATEIAAHRLRREIITTRISNSMINRGGPAFVVRMAEEAAASSADVAYAFMGVRSIFDLPARWAELDALDNRVAADLQLDLYQRLQDFMISQVAQLLRRRVDRDMGALVDEYTAAAAALGAEGAALLTPSGRGRSAHDVASLGAAGVPAEVAARIAALPVLAATMTFADHARRVGRSAVAAARVAYATSEYLVLEEFQARARALKPLDDFDAQAIAGGLAVLQEEAAALADAILAEGEPRMDVRAWVELNVPKLAEAKSKLEKIVMAGDLTISRLMVAAETVRGTAPRNERLRSALASS